MFRKKNDKEVNYTKLNDLISLSHIILKILFVLLIILGTYAVIRLIKEVHILPFIFTILKLLSPLFIGIIIAWLLDPFVTYFNKKGVRRGIGAAFCYVVFLGAIALIVIALIPVLSEQINDLVTNTLPSIFDSAEGWINNLFNQLNNLGNFDAMAI